MDVALSLSLICLLGPLMAAIAIAIEITSGGPVLFRQERIGLRRRRFSIYKFRTMVADAETIQCTVEALNEASGPVFKITNDPRITQIGRWLRRSSLDELPHSLTF